MLQPFPTANENKTGWPWEAFSPLHAFKKKEAYPKITIITPSYNQGEFLEETIRSVLLQDYPNLEYIIIDGGSIDNSVEIIKKYERYLHFWVSEKDNGQSDAINKGVKRATGEIINWLNSDDYYMPGALYHVAEQFSSAETTAYCGRSRIFSRTTERFSQGTDIYENNLIKTIGWARIDQPETFFRKSVWDAIGLLNSEFHYVMDKEWWVRYLFKYGLNGIRKDDRIVVNFRIHEQSKTGSQRLKFDEETLALFYSLASLHKITTAEKISALQTVRAKKLFGYEQIDNKKLENSVQYFILLMVLEAYAKNDFKTAKAAVKILDFEAISADLPELNKVLFRMKYVPAFLKKAMNKIIK